MVGLAPKPMSLVGLAWEEQILQVARLEMNAEVCFYEEAESTTPYDPVTGTGGTNEITVLWSGKARVQHLRTPREFTTPYQPDATRYYRFQLDPADNPPPIYFGVKARVLMGGRDSQLETYAMTANSATNSSHMAVRTVELAANMRPTNWSWNPEPPGDLIYPSDDLYPSNDLFLIGA